MNRLDEAIPYQERATAIWERRGDAEKLAEYQRELDGLKAGEKFPYTAENQMRNSDVVSGIQLHQLAQAARSEVSQIYATSALLRGHTGKARRGRVALQEVARIP